MSMMQTYKNITKRDYENRSPIEGELFTTKEDIRNDYHTEELSVIPAGTLIEGDFAGDFGMYGMAEIGGVIHRIKVPVTELHKIDFGRLDARNTLPSQA